MQFSNSEHTVKLTPNQEICCYMYIVCDLRATRYCELEFISQLFGIISSEL